MGDRKPRARKANSTLSSSSSSSTSSFSSDEETDAQDLKPIRGYLGNRRELARQLFKSVKSDKIRMMLPQILKNMNFNELEEWCASELYGMSEARIISIVNGQPMLDSSDTSETDDSGPSLEIISDTEEWLTDTDVPIKEEPPSSGASKAKKIKANRAKTKNPTGKKNDSEKTRAKAKGKTNSAPVIDSDVQVKKEKEKDNRQTVNKEGESLLDLLELEMRARAIRALIRKEEDIIPTAASEKRLAMSANALRNTLNSAVSASLSSEKSLNGKLNLGESSNNTDKNSHEQSGRNVNTAQDDEDVVFVVAQPTPTIELLSSDNDEETANETKKDKNKETNSATPTEASNLRQNKNDKTAETAPGRDNAIAINERVVRIDKSGGGSDNLKIVITKRVSESSNSPSPTKSSKSKKNSTERADRNISVTTNVNDSSEKILPAVEQTGKGLFKKIKKKPNLRSKRKLNTNDTNTDRTTVVKNSKTSSTDVNDKDKSTDCPIDSEAKADKSNEKDLTELSQLTTVKLESEESREITKTDEREVKKKPRRRITLDEDRLDDFEEIIDLDNYSDDMEDMENIEESKSANRENAKEKPVQEKPKTSAVDCGAKEQSESSETWATRYYQTDDVQNVIKESKIQSEIRKRLRERQRQSKINSSPKLNSPGDSTAATDKVEEKLEPKPTGSVQEYLALKNSTASPNDDTDNTVEKTDTSDNKNADVNQGNKTPAVEKNIAALTASNSSRESTTEIISTEATESQ